MNTVYKATNWTCAGDTEGFSQDHTDYDIPNERPKILWLKLLDPNTFILMGAPRLPEDCIAAEVGRSGLRSPLKTAQLKSLGSAFELVEDPCRVQSRRHPLTAMLALIATKRADCSKCLLSTDEPLSGWFGICQRTPVKAIYLIFHAAPLAMTSQTKCPGDELIIRIFLWDSGHAEDPLERRIKRLDELIQLANELWNQHHPVSKLRNIEVRSNADRLLRSFNPGAKKDGRPVQASVQEEIVVFG